jgi:hypothetical protein
MRHDGVDHPWNAGSRLVFIDWRRKTLAAEIKRRLRCGRLIVECSSKTAKMPIPPSSTVKVGPAPHI